MYTILITRGNAFKWFTYLNSFIIRESIQCFVFSMFLCHILLFQHFISETTTITTRTTSSAGFADYANRNTKTTVCLLKFTYLATPKCKKLVTGSGTCTMDSKPHVFKHENKEILFTCGLCITWSRQCSNQDILQPRPYMQCRSCKTICREQMKK